MSMVPKRQVGQSHCSRIVSDVDFEQLQCAVQCSALDVQKRRKSRHVSVELWRNTKLRASCYAINAQDGRVEFSKQCSKLASKPRAQAVFSARRSRRSPPRNRDADNSRYSEGINPPLVGSGTERGAA
jgi:hypothetical protein